MITFRYQGEGELYGNDVEPRPAYFTNFASRSWIDIDNPLPAGVIERFYIYVHNLTSPLDPQSQRIRLQVWRPVEVERRFFLLIWLQLIQVGNETGRGALYSVCAAYHKHFTYLLTYLLT